MQAVENISALVNVKFQETSQSCSHSKISQSLYFKEQKTLVNREKPSHKKRHTDDGKYIFNLESSKWGKISASSEFVKNVLQTCLIETSLGK